MIQKITAILTFSRRLGFRNVGYIAWYRLALRSGFLKLFFPIGKSVKGTFFLAQGPVSDYPEKWKPDLQKATDELVEGKLTWFSKNKNQAGNPPDWFQNPFENSRLNNPQKHWTELQDFELNTGDIKILWEPSRFHWLTDLARAHRVFGGDKYLKTMNEWLNDWSEKNQPNIGPNWKCGQETSIRILNVVMAAFILEQHQKATPELCRFIYFHLKRVAGNVRYAIAQDNNHGTSEGAGLFVGSAFILKNSSGSKLKKDAVKWLDQGRKLLEERVDYLIANDGSFSQHSVNYHRVLVDTLTLVEHWRNSYKLKPFSKTFYKKAYSAINWLEQMTDLDSGEVPNLGHNDGAMLLRIHSGEYRDFRFSIQTARAIFDEIVRFPEEEYNEPLFWMRKKKSLNQQPVKLQSTIFDNRYVVLHRTGSRGILKLPGFPFRPAQNDTFHFDLWINGINVACDAGSYSYFKPEGEDFSSVSAHNTVQFDNLEPMPKFSRFLYSDWLKPATSQNFESTEEYDRWQGEYSDSAGNIHQREVIAKDNEWEVRDKVQSKENKIFLRWHLPVKKQDLIIRENCVEFQGIEMEFDPELHFTIQPAERSLYYLAKEKIACIVLKINSNQKVITRWKY